MSSICGEGSEQLPAAAGIIMAFRMPAVLTDTDITAQALGLAFKGKWMDKFCLWMKEK